MDAIVRKFWWKPNKEGSHFFSPKAWDSLCQAKRDGGLGFRHFYEFNLALLSKLEWWILEKKDRTCIKNLTAKYRVRRNWLERDSPKELHGHGGERKKL